jgi:Uma2 family endonuclease
MMMATTAPRIALLPDLALRSLDASWNRERWAQLPADGNRYEVIDGVLYVSTAPSSFHWWISRQIVLTLIEQIDGRELGLTAWAPIGLFMPGCDPVQPDIVVVRQADLGIFHDKHIFGVPALLIEILSPSNADQDTRVKRGAYARAGVPEYWIVRPATRDVLVCAQPDAALGDYAQTRLIAPDGELVSPTLPVRAVVAGFFAGAPDTTL